MTLKFFLNWNLWIKYEFQANYQVSVITFRSKYISCKICCIKRCRINTANISTHNSYMIQDIEPSYILILSVYIKRFLIVIDVIIINYLYKYINYLLIYNNLFINLRVPHNGNKSNVKQNDFDFVTSSH